MNENDGFGDLWDLPPWWQVLLALLPPAAFVGLMFVAR